MPRYFFLSLWSVAVWFVISFVFVLTGNKCSVLQKQNIWDLGLLLWPSFYPQIKKKPKLTAVRLTGCAGLISLSRTREVTLGRRLWAAPNAHNLLPLPSACLRNRQRRGWGGVGVSSINHFLGSEPCSWEHWVERMHTLCYHPLLSGVCTNVSARWSRAATTWLQSNCPALATSS